MADLPPLFNVPHDWRTNYTVQLAFSTEILQSDDGTEQRSALRYMPVKTVTFAPSTAGNESRELRSVLDWALLQKIVVPEWTRVTNLTSPLPPGVDVANVAERPYWIKDGHPVILASGSRMQVFNVTVVSPDHMRLDPVPSGETWPAGTRVYRPLIGQPARPSSLSFDTAGAGQHTLTFNVEPESEIGLEYEGVAPMMYNGKEFFAPDINWNEVLGVSFDQLADEIYYDRGIRNIYPRSTYGIRTVQARTYIDGLNAGDKWMQFFMRCRGRQVPFYMPTGQPDINVSQDTLASAYIRHEGAWLMSVYKNSPVFKHIQVLLKDGTRLLRAVVDMQEDPALIDTVVIQVNEPWPRPLLKSEILMVSWVTCCRMASDILLLEWQTQNQGTVGLSVQTLADE